MPNLPRQNDLKEEGFSVLEAMVAMAILAAGLLPILALQGQFVRTVTQIEHVEKSLTAQNNALNLMRTVDLTNVPTGEVQFENYRISYNATPAASTQTVRGNGGFPGRFEVTLYDIQIKIIYLSGREENFSIRNFGWRETSSYLDSF